MLPAIPSIGAKGAVQLKRTKRPRGFATWRPQASSLAIVQAVLTILDEYVASLPLTVRQIFYRLVGAHGFSKTEQAYKNLGTLLTRARRSELISFEAIRADSFSWSGDGGGALGVDDLIDEMLSCAKYFNLDRQVGQPKRIVLACEAAGMAPQLERVAWPFHVPTWALGGFDSVTGQHEASRRIAHLTVCHPVEVLFVGDCDASGHHIATSACENVLAFCDRFAPGADIAFTPIAVTLEQAARFGLPTAPPKASDRRSFAYTETVQAEALAPDLLATIVREALESRIDTEALNHVLKRQETIQAWANRTFPALLHGLAPDELR